MSFLKNLKLKVLSAYEYPEPDKTNISIFRLQNSNKEGPFKYYKQWRTLGNDHMTVQDDSSFSWKVKQMVKDKWLGRLSDELNFGFLNKKQYCEYFLKEERQKLEDLGFQLVKIPAKKVWVGDSQIIYM